MAPAGQFLNLNTSGNSSPGYSGSSGGVVAGIDGTPWQDVRIGAAVGFSSQNISATNAASYRGNAVQLQVYGSARYAIAFLDVQAGGVFTEGTARRTVSAYGVTPGGDISGFGGGASVRGGAHVEVDGWNLEPGVLLSGLALSQDGVNETNGGPVGLQGGRRQCRQPAIPDWYPGGSPCSGRRDLDDFAFRACRLGI
jgi:outer membrane autotransporter protein